MSENIKNCHYLPFYLYVFKGGDHSEERVAITLTAAAASASSVNYKWELVVLCFMGDGKE